MSFGLFKPASSAAAPGHSALQAAPHPAGSLDRCPLILPELLSTRFTHDITGSIGAIHNGVELLDENDPSTQHEALELVSASAKRAIASLTYYRHAYGRIGQPDAPLDSVQLAQTVRSFFSHQPQVQVDLAADIALTAAQGRMLLNMLLLALDGLPRGGSVAVTQSADALTVRSQGGMVQYKPEVMEVLEGKATPDGLTPKSVQPYLLLLMAKEARAQLFYSLQPDQFTVEVR